MESFCRDIYQMLSKKHPNQKIYIISDQHFYHYKIIQYTRTNFEDVLKMNSHIINIHNEIVDKEDIVIFLGDFCFKNHFIKEILMKMNGYKYLLCGNHDSKDIIKNYPMVGFEGVFLEPIKINNSYFSHEPLTYNERTDLHFNLIVNEFKKCSLSHNYHGHIHEPENDISGIYQNVTCEALGYKPLMIGKTTEYKEEKDLFINSSYLGFILDDIKNNYHINPSLLLSDYIYSFLLENNKPYQDQSFVLGSFGLLKKYNFLSKISDLDMSMLYNPMISKRKNIELLKNMSDSLYESLKQIDRVNLRYLKRYPSLKIFEILYTSRNSYFSKNYLDANLIFLDCYKESDFIKLGGISLIEKSLQKSQSSLLEEYQFPKFESYFLKPEGDISNLALQIIFGQGYQNKKILALRKLQYIYINYFKNNQIANFKDTFTRFFLRNICLLYTMNRYGEIEYIQLQLRQPTIPIMPSFLQEQIYDILNHPDFLDISHQISKTKVEDTFKECSKILQKIKS